MLLIICLLVAQSSDAFSAVFNSCTMMDNMAMDMSQQSAQPSLMLHDLSSMDTDCCNSDCACPNVFVSFTFIVNDSQNVNLAIQNGPVISAIPTFSNVVISPPQQPPKHIVS